MYRVKESDLKELATNIETFLKSEGFEVEAQSYFAYGKYGYYFNFNPKDLTKVRQIKVGLGTKRECLNELHTVVQKVLSNKSYYMGK